MKRGFLIYILGKFERREEVWVDFLAVQAKRVTAKLCVRKIIMRNGVKLMERTMSVEDKIRRAEEIYNRRRENEYKTTSARVRVDNKSETTNKNINRRLKRMIIQIIVCMLIYLAFHYIVKNDYIFSEDFKNKCEEILAYDISFSEMYKKISDYIILMQQKLQSTENSEQNKNEKTEQEEQKNDDTQEQNSEENVENSQDGNQELTNE